LPPLQVTSDNRPSVAFCVALVASMGSVVFRPARRVDDDVSDVSGE
jgi:hypothetical protein